METLKAPPPGERLLDIRARGARWHETVIEWVIRIVACVSIIMVFLIFVFVLKEAAPVAFGKVTTARHSEPIPLEKISTLSEAEIASFLHITLAELKECDPAMVRELVQIQNEGLGESSGNPDLQLNTASARFLFFPYQWHGGQYDQPAYVWQPVSEVPKFNMVPLLIGSLKASIVALVFSVPLAILAAIFVSQLATPNVREVCKPAIEMLSGIPSVVLGFFALMVQASILQWLFDYPLRLNAFNAGIALGISVIPIIFTISEDALTSVPTTYRDAGLALGANRWQVSWQVMLPAALPGILAAVVLGFGRVVGETMIVLMASGNAAVVSWDLFDSCRTMTATIAAEMGEVEVGGIHYRMLFFIGILLFLMTFVTNLVGEYLVFRFQGRHGGRGARKILRRATVSAAEQI
jgi:phosphate transport system permease protein